MKIKISISTTEQTMTATETVGEAPKKNTKFSGPLFICSVIVSTYKNPNLPENLKSQGKRDPDSRLCHSIQANYRPNEPIEFDISNN